MDSQNEINANFDMKIDIFWHFKIDGDNRSERDVERILDKRDLFGYIM